MDQCWEADMHFANSPNLVYDVEDRRFKMWNQAVNYDWSTSLLGYYVSKTASVGRSRGWAVRVQVGLLPEKVDPLP